MSYTLVYIPPFGYNLFCIFSCLIFLFTRALFSYGIPAIKSVWWDLSSFLQLYILVIIFFSSRIQSASFLIVSSALMKFPILLTNYGYWKSLPLIFQICIFYGSVFITYCPFDCGSCSHVTWYTWYFLCMTTWRNNLKLRVMLFSFRKDIYICFW